MTTQAVQSATPNPQEDSQPLDNRILDGFSTRTVAADTVTAPLWVVGCQQTCKLCRHAGFRVLHHRNSTSVFEQIWGMLHAEAISVCERPQLVLLSDGQDPQEALQLIEALRWDGYDGCFAVLAEPEVARTIDISLPAGVRLVSGPLTVAELHDLIRWCGSPGRQETSTAPPEPPPKSGVQRRHSLMGTLTDISAAWIRGVAAQ